MCDEKKPWEKPWYPKEIAENASNWTFAADLSLLKYLEVFSEDLLKNATEVDNNVNKLLNNLSKASTSLDIAKNNFLSLSNTQFIESRVYEDDETLLSKAEEEETEEIDTNKNKDEFNKNEMKLAALRGIEVIEKYFDKVEVVDSDSEDEDKLTSFVLRSKDPYIDRPLPYVIGSEMWYKKSHCGLDESSTESEDEKLSEKYSESDSDDDLPIINRSQAKSISESGSFDVDLSNKLDRPVANSTFSDSVKNDNLESSEDLNSTSAQVPTSQDTFAEQLAAKLGNVIRNEVPEAPINTRPIQKNNNYDPYRNMFFDEPPPLEDSDEFSPKSKDQGIFSGGDGLFDDLNDEGIFTSDPYGAGDNKTSFQNNYNSNSLKNNNKSIDSIGTKQDTAKKLQKSKEPSIFDEDDESDDDFLFNSNNNKEKSRKTQNLFEENPQSPEERLQNNEKSSKFFEEDELFKPRHEDKLKSDTSKRKAPIGGIQVIKNPNLFAGENIKKLLKNRPISSESSEDEMVTDQVDKTRPPTKELKNEEVLQQKTQIKKNTGLFDDEDDIFSNISAQNMFSSNFHSKKGGLFDDSEEEIEENKDKLQYSNVKIDNKGKNGGLFDDTDKEIQRNIISTDKNEDKRRNIEEDSRKFTKKNELFDNSDEEIKTKENEDILKRNDAKKPFGMFSDDGSDSDDLFSSSKIITKTKIINEDKKNSNFLKETVAESKKLEKKNTFLFSDEDNEEDDLFSSNFLGKSEKSTSIKQNSTLKKEMLFENADIDVVSKAQSSNEEEKRIFRSENEESLFGSTKNEDIFEDVLAKSVANNVQIENMNEVSEESISPNEISEETVSKLKNSSKESKITRDTKQIMEESDKKVEKKSEFDDYFEDLKSELSNDLFEDPDKSKEKAPTVSIFDPNPPPDDWESRSEHNLFDDDIYSFENTDNITGNRSSIFDREPPSVFFDESSGIVRDHIVTRTEDDTTLFNPYASSTRRLSSDLFNEDQSNDSLFTAKRDSTLEVKIPPSILENSEDFDESNLAITPSGKIEDLYSESSEISETQTTNENERSNKPILTKKPNFNKVEVKKEEFGDKVVKDGTPGKLKHNLNINVFSLLPGAGPKKVPKKDPPQRSQSLDFKENLDSEEVTKDSAKISEKIEVPSSNIEVLDSITKNRVKGPGNRRPSSKKARDAIRNSCVDFSFLTTTTPEDNENESETVEKPTKDATIYQKSPDIDKLLFKNELLSKLSLDKDILKGRKLAKSTKEPFKVDSEKKEDITSKSPIKIPPKATIVDELEYKLIEDKQSEVKSSKNEDITSKIASEGGDISEKTSKTESNKIDITPKSNVDIGARADTKEINDILNQIKTKEFQSIPKIPRIKPQNITKIDKTKDAKQTNISDPPKILKGEIKEVEQKNTSDPLKIAKDETKEVKQSMISDAPKITKEEIKQTKILEAPKIIKDETKEIKQMNVSEAPKITKEETKEIKQTKILEAPKITKDEAKETKQMNVSEAPKITKEETKEIKQTNTLDPPKITKEETKEIKQTNTLDPPKITKDDDPKSDKIKGILKIDKVANASKNIDFLSELLGYDEPAKTLETNKIGENSKNNQPKSESSTNFFNSFLNDDPKSKRKIIKPPKDIFGDDLDDDLDLFSSSSTRKVNKNNLTLPVTDANPLDGRRSSFVKTDNFASPEFIKENLSEDEDDDGIFKLPPKSSMFKNSKLDDDDEDGDSDEFFKSRIKKTVSAPGIRRLKPASTLKKLENVPITGDDPLNAL